MDTLRVERLVWAVVFAALVALVVAFAFVPEGLGLPPLAVALVTFLVVAPLVVRLSRNATALDAEPGDQTIQYVTFFLVAAGGQVGLGALGYDSFGTRLATFAAGWLVAVRAKRLNPRRWRSEQAA